MQQQAPASAEPFAPVTSRPHAQQSALWLPSACLDLAWLVVMAVAVIRYPDPYFLIGLSAGFVLAFAPNGWSELPIRPVLTAVMLPAAYAIDRGHGSFFVEFFGFRQPLGVGAGLLFALGFLGPSFWRRRTRLDRDVWLLEAVFALLVLSAFRADSNPDAVDQLFGVLLPLAAVARFGLGSIAVHGRTGVRGLAAMVVTIAATGGLMRWILEGLGPSSSQFRAGVDWYVGPAVNASSALLPALPLAAWLVVTSHSARQRGAFIFAGLVVALEIIWSERKLGVLMVALQALAIIAVSMRRARGARQRSAGQRRRTLLSVGAAIVVFVFSLRSIEERLGDLYGGDLVGNASDQGRLKAQSAFLRAAIERPGGWGLDGIAHSTTSLDGFYSPHNTLLGVAVDAGLVAGALIAVWWLSRLVSQFIRLKQDATPDLVFIRVASLTAFFMLVIDGPDYNAHPLPSGAGLMLALTLAYVPRSLSARPFYNGAARRP